MMNTYLSQEDINTRLQNAYCCAGSLAFKINREYRYGLKCANHHLEDLFLLNTFIEILECYSPYIPTLVISDIPTVAPSGGIGSVSMVESIGGLIPLETTIDWDPITSNCITEEKAQYLFEQMSRICRTCFDSTQTTY